MLRAALPPTPGGFTATVFRERPGLVTQHLKQNASLAGTFTISDLRTEPGSPLDTFTGATDTVHGWPAVSTSMGGGVAALVEKRFKVEAVSLGAELGAARRDSWLQSADFDRLAALARQETAP